MLKAFLGATVLCLGAFATSAYAESPEGDTKVLAAIKLDFGNAGFNSGGFNSLSFRAGISPNNSLAGSRLQLPLVQVDLIPDHSRSMSVLGMRWSYDSNGNRLHATDDKNSLNGKTIGWTVGAAVAGGAIVIGGVVLLFKRAIERELGDEGEVHQGGGTSDKPQSMCSANTPTACL